MTVFAHTRATISTNPNGIIRSVMVFNLQEAVKSNVPLYFYRFNSHNLVEVQFTDDLINFIDFPHTDNGAFKSIKNDLEKQAEYFTAAGLHGKRFLYDWVIKMPVARTDFIRTESKLILTNGHAFILDNPETSKERYITEKAGVFYFIHTANAGAVDNSVLSFMNLAINFRKPMNSATEFGQMTSIVLAGLFAGISMRDLKEQIPEIDKKARFCYSINTMEFNSEYLQRKYESLKTEKLLSILLNSFPDEKEEKLPDKLPLSLIVEKGLGIFLKKIGKKKVIEVELDIASDIRFMYLKDEAAWVSPVAAGIPLQALREFLDSDEVFFIVN